MPLSAHAISGGASVSGTKKLVGTTLSDEGIRQLYYEFTLTNSGAAAQGNNPGREFTDPIPANTTFVSASCSQGSVSFDGTSFYWEGSLDPSGGSVDLTLVVSVNVNSVPVGTTISNQGTISYDGNNDGVNESTAVTDDPDTIAANDPTLFVVDTAQSGPNFVVNKTNDHADDGVCGTADCTLREAINAASNVVGIGTVTFDTTVFANQQTITLSNDIVIYQGNITITGSTAGVTISQLGGNGLGFSAGTAKLVNLTFAGCASGVRNSAFGLGANKGSTLTMQGCTFSANTAAGYTSNYGTLQAQNCTFSGNGAAIDTVRIITLDSCTISGNNKGLLYGGNGVTVSNSIIAGNTTNEETIGSGGGTITDGGHNLRGMTATATQAGLDPNGLQNNGGPTQTIALVAGGAAVNTGQTDLSTDQRSKPRPFGSADDIGAYELQNTAPTLTSVTIKPVAPKTNDTLTATVVASDTEKDTITYTYVWKTGGATKRTTITTATSDTFDLSVDGNGDKGQTVTCTVTPNDGTVNGTSGSDSVTIQNSAPVIKSVTINQKAPKTNDILSVTIDATDDDGDQVTKLYQWIKNSFDRASQTGPTYDLSQADNGNRGDKISVRVTVSDNTDSPSKESPQVTIQNSVPVITVVAVNPVAPDLLTAYVAATDDDGDPLNYTYAWRKNGELVAADFNYKETLDLSKPGVGDDGDSITVTVTASDGIASSTGEPVFPLIVGNRLPAVFSVSPQDVTDTVGSPRTFTLVMSDGNGARDIKEMWLLINTTLDWSGGATLIYRPSAASPTNGLLYLRQGDAFLPPIKVGTGSSSTDVLDNGAVRVVGSDVAVRLSRDGNFITLTLPVIVREGLAGENTLFARVQDGDGATDPAAQPGEFGFLRDGHYTVWSPTRSSTNTAPTLSKLTPGATYTTLNAAGIAPAPQTFGFFVQDADGTTDIESVWFLAGKVRSWAHSATFVYYPRTRRLYLRSDDGSTFLGGGRIGSEGIIENSQVRVDLSKVILRIYPDGKSLGLSLPLQGKSGLLGHNTIWLRVQDTRGATSPDGDDLGFVNKDKPKTKPTYNWDLKSGTKADPAPQPSNGHS
ncbi:hypothetical protein IAD21_00652 [Abditibacteriota bacterium]|nr:hypothetical protein IAD21_00652 [Abditibacteriota bacterium]